MSAISGEPRPATESQELSPDERAELERLRAEKAESGGKGGARRRRIGWRTPVAILLIVLGCLLAPVAAVSRRLEHHRDREDQQDHAARDR